MVTSGKILEFVEPVTEVEIEDIEGEEAVSESERLMGNTTPPRHHHIST